METETKGRFSRLESSNPFSKLSRREQLVALFFGSVFLFCLSITVYFKLTNYNDYVIQISVLMFQATWLLYKYYPEGSIRSKDILVHCGVSLIVGLVFIVAITSAWASPRPHETGRPQLSVFGTIGFPLTALYAWIGTLLLNPYLMEKYYKKARYHTVTPLELEPLDQEEDKGSKEMVENTDNEGSVWIGDKESERGFSIRRQVYGVARFDEKWTEGSVHLELTYFLAFLMGVSQTLIVYLGWVSYTISGVINLLLLLVWAIRVLWESNKAPPIRHAKGYIIMIGFISFGASSVPRTLFEVAAAAKDSSITQVMVFISFVFIMSCIVFLMWKASILFGDQDSSVIFAFMALDDLFGDAIIGNQNVDGFLVITILFLAARLILRDTGLLEDWFNRFMEWNRPGSLTKEALMEELQMSQQERETYRMYRKLAYHAKYIKIAKMDLLSEHLSVLVIPLFLILDYYMGGYCLFACGFASEAQIWTSVAVYFVLFIVKSIVNKIVLKIQDRQMDSLQTELDDFQAKWGKLERNSILNVWATYIKGDIPPTLHEQVDLAKTRIMERNFVWFVTAACFASMNALCITGCGGV